MTLIETLCAAGMTPPASITPERWFRFPGCGKGKSNRAGWCRLISPTLAIYGDWSTGVSDTWRDDSHRDDAESARLLAEARTRQKCIAEDQRRRQRDAAEQAAALVRDALISRHPYLVRKGFPELEGLVARGKLLIPVRDVSDYARIISVQEIDEHGAKRFLVGSRARSGIHRIGAPLERATRIALCEGYATGLSIDAALRRLSAPHAVVVCFSARNLEVVAEALPKGVVCADNDESKTGEMAARRTGLFWTMPPDIGTDFNDMHQRHGLPAVTEVMRTMF